MKKWVSALFAVQLTALVTHNVLANTAPALDLPTSISTFAFASCAKERKPQPIWKTIKRTNPELFLFIGDNVYADYWKADGVHLKGSPVTKVERIEEAYGTLAAKPEFSSFRASVPILATWDDHDYGANDAGKRYPLKRQSQARFLDFFGFAKNDPIRKQAGIYYSRTIGQKNQKVQFIMLDTRYHRDDLVKNDKKHVVKSRYLVNTQPSATMLGDAQWQWLEAELKKPADIRFLISSIQLVAYEHGYESWGIFPHERQRLYDLIAKTKAEGVVVLSGDRHLTEVSVDNGQLGASVPYPIWDLTASGMTDPIEIIDGKNTFRKGAVYRGSHFATVNIDWHRHKNDTQIVFRAVTDAGKLINEQRIRLGDLSI